MKNIIIAMIFATLLLAITQLTATTINIPGDQPTIQSGINVSVDSDTILVQPGTYTENINFDGKNIVVASLFLITLEDSYINQTIIDGNQNGSVVTFENGETSAAMICGFTITNGSGNQLIGLNFMGGGGICCYQSNPVIDHMQIEQNTVVNGDGGGIICYNFSNAEINNCNIVNNSSMGYDGDAGGIYVRDSNPIIKNTVIANNSASDNGGGMSFSFSDPVIENVVFYNNFASDKGGAITCGNDSNALFDHIIVYQNTAVDKGGSIFCSALGSITMLNSTITNNSSPWSSIYTESSDLTITNSIIYDDDSPEEIIYTYGSLNHIMYSNVHNWTFGGIGNIDANPLFVEPENGNFHLQEDSPCIDAGDPSSPLDPDGTITDMGAFYFQQILADFTAEPLSGELPLDVQFSDLSIGNLTFYMWDFNNDGFIDSNEQNPSFTFYDPGFYTVSLTVYDTENSDTETKTDYIVVFDSLCADFEGTPLYGASPLEVQFTNLSTGNITFYMWDFNNDGFVDSNEQNPSFTFQQSGTYDVSLTITDGISEDTELKMQYITVTDTTSVNNSISVTQTEILQNYPNPFNPTTTISFSLNQEANNKIELAIYNLKGQLVKTFSNIPIENTVDHQIVWNGTNELGEPVSSGLYFYILKTNTQTYTRKMMLLK